MIDWLRKERGDPFGNPHIDIAGRALPIVVRRHANAKRLTMRLAPDGTEVRITMPRWGRTLDAVDFAKARESWIAGQLAKTIKSAPVAPDAPIMFRGAPRMIDWRPDAARKPQLHSQGIILGGPEHSIERRLQRWLEAE